MTKTMLNSLRASLTCILTCLILLSISLRGQDKTETEKHSADLHVPEIIRRFSENESRLRQEYKNYLYKQDVTLQTLTSTGNVTGEFRRTSEIVVDDRGQRSERILFFPQSTLAGITITQADYNDLAGIQPFALAREDLSKYRLNYGGREKIDEINAYVFDVSPAVALNPKKIEERFFEGRIWVDDTDLTIVKVSGRGVPQNENNQFPRFETYRENIAQHLWFPTYTYADDVLQFKFGPIRMRMTVRYTDYRRFSGKIEVVDEPGTPVPPSAAPKKEKKP